MLFRTLVFTIGLAVSCGSCTSTVEEPLTQNSSPTGLEEGAVAHTDGYAWLEDIPMKRLCPSIMDTSVTASWTEMISAEPSTERYPGDEQNMIAEPNDASCIFGRVGRIAEVRIDAIVRDYMNPDVGSSNWTVYRLEIENVLKGGALPRFVYAAATTGRCSWEMGTRTDCKAYQTALRTVEERGIALLSSLGLDPILAQARMANENFYGSVIPARMLSFGIFLPKRENSNFDLARESFDLSRLVGSEASIEEIESQVSRIGTVNCPQNPSVCGNCDTSESCYGSSFDPPCGCVNGLKSCSELEVEDSQYCRIHQP